MDRVTEKISQVQSVLVIGHVSPDGDSLGSTLALYHLLKNQGKTVYAVCPGQIPNKYLYLPGCEDVLTGLDKWPVVDALILLDCGELNRAGVPDNVRFESVINIDHHTSNPRLFEAAWVDPSFASVGQQILRLAESQRWPISPEIATCLYTSIATDTGFFRHSNTTPEVLRDAARLMELKADARAVVENAAERRSLGELCLLQNALSSLTQESNGRITVIEVPQSVFITCGVGVDEAEGLVEYSRAVPGTQIAVLLREVDSATTRVSLRARGEIDVSKVAVSFGGGGHKLAAGCTINASLPEARRELLASLNEVLLHA